MFKKLKQKQHSNIAFIAVALLLVCTLTVTAFAAADLSGTIGVSGLNAASSGAKDWTASAGGAAWEGTTSSSGGCSPTYTSTNGTLVFTNNSGSTQVLSFDYTLSLGGGSFTVAGESKTANGSFSQALANGASVTLVATSPSNAANTTKVTLSNIKLAVQSVNITFAAPTNGSYTMNGTAITANTTVTNPSTTTYKLVATPAANYHFDGWYLGDTKVYETATVNAAAFATTGTVTARFKIDPLYNQATVPADCTMTKDQLVSINTYYLHDTTNKLVADGGFPGNNSAYSKTAQSGTKDKIDVQYVPFSVWNDSMAISASGTAMGDYVDGGGQESYAYARVISDVIRIYAKENCNITFNYNGSFTTGGSSATETNANAYTYTYVTTASNATVAQVKGGTQYTGSGTTPTIALSKGNYLYILTEGYARNRYLNILGSSQFSMSYDYSASISGFSVELNIKKDVLTAGFRDNTGTALTSGTLSVNNVGQAIGTNGNMADMTFADQAAVTLAVSAVPANYVHIGWEVTPEGGSATRVYTPTYSRTLTENVTVNALFVPKTIITMGANGYSDATYTDASGTALNGQYVARNAGCTAYYTSLADAFSQTDVVVLLAGSTINGDWTIPAGKTFVIPYGMNDAGSTTPVMGWGMGADYCLVNLNGNLNVAGTLLVSALQNQSTGATGGNPGHLVVASGKTITVSGSLYAYGPVTGAGKVETTATAQIHETLEFSDNAPVMYVYNIYNEKSSMKVFPFNTLFINSIEIPVTYQLGATLTAHAAVRYDTPSTAAIPIIAGSGALLNHTAGTVTKYYDANAGQFVFRINSGSTVNTGSFSITLTVTVAGRTMDITMNSADYYIPLPAPIRFEVAGDLTINDNYKALPGMTIDVQEGGTMTVASGKNLIFYRANDYDYRGKHANSTEQWGYGERAYPINPQRYKGVSYPFSFSNSNMGSAKLNVDGTLIVNGGLYVTNELQTAGDGITLQANGYNYLTGSGTINMSNAATSLTSINEVMRAQGTNDLAWDTVAIVPMKGLKADATADDPAQYESLNDKTVTGSINANGLNVWGADPCAGGHTLTATEAKESNCYQQGNSAYWYCSVCEKYFSDEACTTVIEKDSWLLELAEHTYDEGAVTTEPNCTEKGVKTYTCSVCPEGTDGHTRTEEVAATGHTEVIDAAVAPTCMATGLTEGMHCSVCKAVLTAQTVVEKIDHTWDNGTQTKAPTCSEEGVTTFTCTFANSEGNACGATKTAAITKLPHTEGAVVVENEVAATCAAEGSYDNVVYCSVCNTELSRSTVTVEKFAHTSAAAVEENRVESTCSVAGSYDEVVYCSVCGEEVSRETKALELAAHTEGAVVVENEVAATCTATGSYDNVVYCTVCNAELSRDTVTVDKIAHTPAAAVEENRVESTCTVAGSYESVVYCSACNTELSRETKALELAAHTEGAVVVENEVAATCTATGSYDNVVYCTVCNAELSRNTVTVDKIAHAYKAEVTAPTCTAKGYTTYTCSACGDSYVADETEMVAHTPADAVKENEVASTCTVAGSYDEVVYCSVCNGELSRNTVTVDALGHSYNADVTAPTCNAQGYTTYTCSVCGDSYVDDYVQAEHKVPDGSMVCTACGEIIVDYAGQKLHIPKDVVASLIGSTYYGPNIGSEKLMVQIDRTAEIAGDMGMIQNVVQTQRFVDASLRAFGIDPTGNFADDFNTLTYEATRLALQKLGLETVDPENQAEVQKIVQQITDNALVLYTAQCTTQMGMDEAKHLLDGVTSTDIRAAMAEDRSDEEKAKGMTQAALAYAMYYAYVNSEYAPEDLTDELKQNPTAAAVGNALDNDEAFLSYMGSAQGVKDMEAYLQAMKVVNSNIENPEAVKRLAVEGFADPVFVAVVERMMHYEYNGGHNYEPKVTEPDCTAPGYTTYTCSVCGDSYVDNETEALGHTAGDVVVENEKAATCSAEGSYDNVVYCTVCEKEISRETVTVDALPHTEVIDKAVEPTCTATGLTEGKHCSVCNATLVAQEVVPVKNHTEEIIPAVAATCSATGLTEGKKCSVCGTIIVAQTTIEKLSHTEETIPGKAATCTETGLTEGKKCAVCGTVTVAQESIDKIAHTEEILPGKAATCTETGLTEGKKCSVCKETLIAQEIIDALGHTEKTIPGKAPTCTETGLDDGKQCTVCGVVTDPQTEIPATGHKWDDGICQNDGSHTCPGHNYDSETGICNVCKAGCQHSYSDEITEPDCINPGYTTHTCGICNHSYQDTHVDALGHSWVEATCTVPKTCSVCGATEGTENGHNYETNVTAPTCTAQGYTTHKCSVCGDTYTDSFTEMVAHTSGTPVVENEVAADCDENGSYDNVTYCTVCNTELSRNTVPVPATGHTPGDTVVENNTDATCTATGSYDNVVYCTVCKAELSRETVIVDALGHKYESTVVAPTCEAKGYTKYTCSVCSDSYQNTYVDALGHTAETVPGKAPTCTETGLTDGSKCSVCGATLAAQEEIAALGHSHVPTVTAPTCTEKGYTTYTCACGDTYKSNEVAALGHTEAEAVVENEVAATCTKEGSYDEVVYCSACKAEISRVTTIVDKVAHTEEEISAVDATCTEPGLTEGTKCSKCGEILVAQEEIPAKGHTEVEIPAVDATCVDAGNTAGVKCAICNTVITEPKEVPATGVHNYVNGECTVCGDKEASAVAFVDNGNSLVLDGAISIRQFLSFDNLDMTREEIEANGGLEITKEDGTTYTVPLEYNGQYRGKAEYVATTEGIASIYMGDVMIFRPYIVVNGKTIYGDEKEMSVRIWAEEKIGGTGTERLKATLAALLNYGAEAQTYLKYKTDRLMNSSLQGFVDSGRLNASYLEQNWSNELLDTVINPEESMTVNFARTDTVNVSARTLVLEAAISLKYYVSIGKDASAFKDSEDAKFYFWTASDYQKYLEAGTPLTKENASYVVDAELQYTAQYGYEYTAASKQFASIYMGETVYVSFAVTDAEGKEHSIGVDPYSVEEYANGKINDNNPNAQIDKVCKWLVIYGERAKDYLSNKS
ncbi:MAG: hypothetical protein IJA75_00375 [Oscillospiraceae bacterium]|nr:hypothetical protein [Oscillospiraceae bacterium]